MSDSKTPAIGVPLLVLNYNGRMLLEECLPSVLRAATASRHDCRVWVVDNASSDDSLAWLARHYPQVGVIRRPNRGLCSFNDVLADWDCPLAVLLNNDVKLEENCVDALVAPLLSRRPGRHPCFLAAPLCWQFDGQTCEGLKTAVRWRFGLVQATGRFPGHEEVLHMPGLTASAGAVLAVDRRIFMKLGGFDPLYLPGRIEDLDFAFRGYLEGYRAEYVPDAVAYHKGQASFGPAFSASGCQHLALRNTLLFQWKNLRHPWHLARQLGGLTVRMMRDVAMAPFVVPGRRFILIKAFAAALCRAAQIRAPERTQRSLKHERSFFREFHPRRLRRANEPLLDRRHPLSRLYLLLWADRLAARLATTAIRPWHVTLLGFALVCAAGACLIGNYLIAAAGLVLAAWFCDRLDGKLARRQDTVTLWGGWLDANLDELADIGLHAAAAFAASAVVNSAWPWVLFAAFVVGKYLLVHGLATEPATTLTGRASEGQCRCANDGQSAVPRSRVGLMSQLYHLPGNADVRTHLLAVCLACGWLTAELAFVAAYYNFRWLARYALVTRRLARSPETQILNPEP